MDPTVFVIIEYDELAFEPSELAELQDQFSQVGPIRLRSAYKERGDDFTTLWFVVTFIGLKYVEGFISGVASAHVARISEKIQNFLSHRRRAQPSYCQVISIRLSYDDVDVAINLPTDATGDFLQILAQRVYEHLSKEPLRSSGTRHIILPVQPGEEGWEEATDWSVSQHLDRYWGVGENGAPVMTSVYDSETGTFLDLSFEELYGSPDITRVA